MITLQGTLTIRSITGRNGRFNVGRLTTEIGEFTVKDELIEEFDEGAYQGQFNVAQVYPTSYFAGNRLVVEVRARVLSLSIDEGEAGAVEEQLEKDPLDEQESSATVQPAAEETVTVSTEGTTEPVSDANVDTPPAEAPVEEGEEAQLANLFGTIWPLGDVVQLDPTVGRDKFRSQRDALKARGYKFEPTEQKWVKSAEAAA